MYSEYIKLNYLLEAVDCKQCKFIAVSNFKQWMQIFLNIMFLHRWEDFS